MAGQGNWTGTHHKGTCCICHNEGRRGVEAEYPLAGGPSKAKERLCEKHSLITEACAVCGEEKVVATEYNASRYGFDMNTCRQCLSWATKCVECGDVSRGFTSAKLSTEEDHTSWMYPKTDKQVWQGPPADGSDPSFKEHPELWTVQIPFGELIRASRYSPFYFEPWGSYDDDDYAPSDYYSNGAFTSLMCVHCTRAFDWLEMDLTVTNTYRICNPYVPEAERPERKPASVPPVAPPIHTPEISAMLMKELKLDLPSIPIEAMGKGVYLLSDDTEVVYVGQSLTTLNRIRAHKDKDFGSIRFVPVQDRSFLNDVEGYLIHYFDPKYNQKSEGNPKHFPVVRDWLEQSFSICEQVLV